VLILRDKAGEKIIKNSILPDDLNVFTEKWLYEHILVV
jgi:hypothetical protein